MSMILMLARFSGLAGIFLFDAYLKLNVVAIGEVSPYQWLLFLAFLLLGYSTVWLLYSGKSVTVPEYAWLLLLFFAYYCFRLGVDFASWSYLKSGLVGTTGGVLLFYLFGSLVIYSSRIGFIGLVNKPVVYLFMLVLLLSNSLILSYKLFSLLRSDLFLLGALGGQYQRPGAFITISMLLNFLVFFCAYTNCHMGRSKRLFFLVIFACNCAVCAALAQALGSNNGTVNVLGILIVGLMLFLATSSVAVYESKQARPTFVSVSYTHLTLPTNREV